MLQTSVGFRGWCIVLLHSFARLVCCNDSFCDSVDGSKIPFPTTVWLVLELEKIMGESSVTSTGELIPDLWLSSINSLS